MENEYILPTRYCDSDNPKVQELAYHLAAGLYCPVEKAKAIFNFVRDEIKYRFDYTSVRASETLAKKNGTCFNKANLQIALGRALRIPSAYGVSLIHKNALMPVAKPEIFKLINEPTVHIWTKFFLENKWVSADATVDKELFCAAYLGIKGWSYDNWDGATNLEMNKIFVVKDQGIYAGIDLYLDMPPKFLNDGVISQANQYIENLLARKAGG